MPQNNLPRRGTARITLGSLKTAKKEKEQKWQQAEKEQTRREKAKEIKAAVNDDSDPREVNGFFYLFKMDKTGFMTLEKPVLTDYVDDKGNFDMKAYGVAVQQCEDTCYDIVKAIRRTGFPYYFSPNWKEEGRLFFYNKRAVKKTS
jgi:hypothetical protein